MGWGRKSACGGCGECERCKKAAYMRAYYQGKTPEERKRIFRDGRDAERVRRQDLERHDRKRSDPEYRKRRHANALLNRAIRQGKIERQPCEVCGGEPAHGHHDDYDAPYDVRWLCPPCHAREHQQLAEAA